MSLSAGDFGPTELRDVRAALHYISPDMAHAEWAMIASSIKAEFPDAFDVYDDWSADGSTYDRGACRATWRSAKPHRTCGALFKRAMDNGYKPERRELSAEDRERLDRDRARRLAERKQREAEEQRLAELLRRKTAKLVQHLWAHELKPVGESKYLAGKGVKAHGLGFPRRGILVISDSRSGSVSLVTDPERVRSALPRLGNKPDGVSTRYFRKGLVVVPMQDAHGMLVNLQFLWGSGKKSFFLGGQKQGAFHVICEDKLYRQTQSPTPPICVGEGYATMATVYEATGYPCVVAFDAGNLGPVCRVIRDRFPSHSIIVCGDNDWQCSHKKGAACADRKGSPCINNPDKKCIGNTGRQAAEAAARAVCSPGRVDAWAVFPDFDHTYANDVKEIANG